MLRALEATDGVDPARLAHHARQAGDTVAIRRHAPVAARSASAAGSHRQALEHWEAALAADAGTVALEGVSLEGYLCGELDRALEARRALLRIHEAGEEPNRVGEDLRWLSRILWWAGEGAEAAAAADQAIAVLESLPESRELAMALSGRSQLADAQRAPPRGDRGRQPRDRPGAAHRRPGDVRPRAHERRDRRARARRPRAGPVHARGRPCPRRRGRGGRPCGPRARQPRDLHADAPSRRPPGRARSGARDRVRRRARPRRLRPVPPRRPRPPAPAARRVGRGGGRRARLDGHGRAPRRQPLPGAHRARPAAVATRRARGDRHPGGRMGARGLHRRAAAARAGGGRPGRARMARRRSRRERRGDPEGLAGGEPARRRLGARRAGLVAVARRRARQRAVRPRRIRTRARSLATGIARRRPGRRSASRTRPPRC